jgi:hypothetical protein
MEDQIFTLIGDQPEKVAKIVVKPDKTIGTNLAPVSIVMPGDPVAHPVVAVLDCHNEVIGAITIPQAFSLA